MINANMLSNLSAVIQKVGLGELDLVLVEEVKLLLIEGTHQDLFHSVVQMAPHLSFLTWEIPWTEKPSGL